MMKTSTLKRLNSLLVFCTAIILTVSSFSTSVAFIDDDDEVEAVDSGFLFMEAETFDPLVSPPSPPPSLADDGKIRAGEDEVIYFIIQFKEKVREDRKARMIETGAQILGYLPKNAYLVSSDEETVEAIGKMESVRWIGPWSPYYKLTRKVREDLLLSREQMKKAEKFVAILFPGADLEKAMEDLDARGVEIHQVVDMSDVGREGSLFPDRIVFGGIADEVFAVARINSVSWIEPLLLPEKRNDKAQWVIQTNQTNNRSIWQKRIFGIGQIIGHIDGRLDINSCYFRDDVNPVGPLHRKIVAYRSNSGFGSDSHGTHTAGTTAGEATYVGGEWTYDGMAPGAKLSHSNLDDINNSNLAQYFLYAYQDDAFIHTNSWGNDWTTSYTQWCRDIDQVSHHYEDNLICFAVTNMNNLKTPENAKNVLAVGATSQAPNQQNHCTGGKGPTSDGRRKPEIYAPGCDTRSARYNRDCSTWTMSGTSMASPAVAGAGALVREYYEAGWYPTGIKEPGNSLSPSGALVKATLLNSTVDMTGVSGYPSDREGWGRVLLENSLFFDGDPHGLIARDVRMSEGLSTGDREILFFDVSSSDVPLNVTLVWHDYPASVGASFTPVNNLDIFIRSPGESIYRGNVFSGGQSVPGGSSDVLNNVEQIRINTPEVGEWGLLVRAKEVNMGPQGYALAISGDVNEVP